MSVSPRGLPEGLVHFYGRYIWAADATASLTFYKLYFFSRIECTWKEETDKKS